MSSAQDAENAYERACMSVLAARACLVRYAAPPPDFEVTIPDGQWEVVRRADAAAGEAERKMREALEIIRTGLLGYAPAEPPYDGEGRDGDG